MSNHLEHGNHNPYVQHTPTDSSSAQPGKRDKMWDVLGRCGKMLEGYGKMAEEVAENVWHHIKVSPSITDAAKARFVQGTKVIAEGGPQKLFQHTFGVIPGEKYISSYACYLADPSGPVNGTLYISTKRVAFCSESPLCYSSSPGQPQWVYYKRIGIDAIYSMSNPLDAKDNPYVQYSSASPSPNGKYKMWEATFEDCSRMIEAVADSVWNHLKLGSSVTDAAWPGFIPLGRSYLQKVVLVVIAVDQLGQINPSSNLMDPSQKYIQIITRDSHEFWFMGFISYNKAVKTLTVALQRSRA